MPQDNKEQRDSLESRVLRASLATLDLQDSRVRGVLRVLRGLEVMQDRMARRVIMVSQVLQDRQVLLDSPELLDQLESKEMLGRLEMSVHQGTRELPGLGETTGLPEHLGLMVNQVNPGLQDNREMLEIRGRLEEMATQDHLALRERRGRVDQQEPVEP